MSPCLTERKAKKSKRDGSKTKERNNADEKVKEEKTPSKTRPGGAPEDSGGAPGGGAGSSSGEGGIGSGKGVGREYKVQFPDGQRLFIGNLPHKCTENDLRDLFGQYGKVADIHISNQGAELSKQQPDGKHVPNFGFVSFEEARAMQRVLSHLEKKPIFLYGNYRLKVEVKGTKAKEESKPRKWKVGDKCKIRLSKQDIEMIHKRGCFHVHGHEHGTWQGEVTEVDSDFCKVRYDETDDFVQFHWLNDLLPIEHEEEKKTKPVRGKCAAESESVGSMEKEQKDNGGAAAAPADDAKSGGEKAGDKKSGAKILWVSGLGPSVRAADLQNHFSKAGKVTGAKVVTNAKMPGSKCYGIVTMSTKEEADKILKEMAKTEIAGRKVTVELCNSKSVKVIAEAKVISEAKVVAEAEKTQWKVGDRCKMRAEVTIDGIEREGKIMEIASDASSCQIRYDDPVEWTEADFMDLFHHHRLDELRPALTDDKSVFALVATMDLPEEETPECGQLKLHIYLENLLRLSVKEDEGVLLRLLPGVPKLVVQLLNFEIEPEMFTEKLRHALLSAPLKISMAAAPARSVPQILHYPSFIKKHISGVRNSISAGERTLPGIELTDLKVGAKDSPKQRDGGKEKEKRVTKVGEAIRELLSEAVEWKAAMRETLREMQELAENAKKTGAEIKRFKTVVREENNPKQYARLKAKQSKLKADHKQLETEKDQKNSEMDKVEEKLKLIEGIIMNELANCNEDLYDEDNTILEEVKQIFPNILEKLLKIIDQQPELVIENAGLRRELSDLKAEQNQKEADLLQKQQEMGEDPTLTDEQREEFQQIKLAILKCVVALNEAKDSLPGLAEVVESQKQIRNEIKARLKTKETAKLREDLSKVEEVLKDAVETMVEKRTKIREEERKLERLRDRLDDIDTHPDNYKPKKPEKWKVGHKCRVNVKIKHKPKECEAEIMEIPEDSSDASVSIHGYGYLLRVPLDQLEPSRGDKEREAQWNEAIKYHIVRVEEPSKDDKKVTEEDIQVNGDT